jgi:SAM-dependent methyltransferase
MYQRLGRPRNVTTYVCAVPEANADQREYWNGDESREWADEPSRFDEMLEPFGTRALDVADVRPGARVLDVGCGNGAVTIEAAVRAGGDGSAIGIDLSEPMLINARERAAARGLGNTTFVAADAQVAALDGPFDAATSRFGIMFFDDPAAAFANIVGSLAPAGRLAFACWRTVPENEWVAVQAAAVAEHVPLPDFSGDGPGPFRYGDPTALVETLARAGLRDVEAEPFDTTLLLGGRGSLDDIMRYVERNGMTRRFLGDAEADQRARAIESVRAALTPFVTEEGLRLGAAAWIVSGHRR